MSFADLIASTLTFATAQSSGTMVHGSDTYSVYKAYSTGDARVMLDAGYDPDVVDLVVLVKVSDISGSNPATGDDVTLDGASYVVKSPVTSNAVFVMVPLREAN